MAQKGVKTKVAQGKSEIVAAIPRACADELAAVEFFEKQRWGDCPACPHCGSVGVYKMVDAATGGRNKRYLWRCHDCKRQFTVRIGTVLEESRIPLKHWAYAFWAACSSKKGVSALQIRRMTGLSYKSALFLMHRIRFAMADLPDTPPTKLSGTIEVDETYVGGKPRNRGTGHQTKKPRKSVVMALVERDGNVRVRHIRSATRKNLGREIFRHTDWVNSRLITDEYLAYRKPGRVFGKGHETVQHNIGEYVRGDVYTNTVEGFFALLKRGIIGTFHQVSKKHLHRYCAEFEFRYNTRKIDDGARTAMAIKRSEGKRLRYRDPISMSA